MRKRGYLLILGLVFFMTTLSSAQTYEQYQVQSGDTLGSIAQSRVNISNPVYGRDGKLETLLKMNPHIGSNVDVIYPGQIINLAQGYYVNPPYEDRRPSTAQTLSLTPALTPAPEVVAPAPAPAAPVAVPPAPVVAAHAPTPAPAPAPVPPAALAAVEEDQPLLLNLKVGLVYARIDAQDRSNQSKAVFVSDLLPEIHLGLSQELAPSWTLNTRASVRFNKYLAPSSTVTLEQPGQTTSFHLGVQKDFGKKFRAELQGGMRQSLFARATSNTTYVLDRAPVSFVGLRFDANLWQGPRFEASLYGNVQALGSSKTTGHNVDAGSSYEFGAHLRRQRRSLFFDQTLFYSNTLQNSNLVKQNSQDLGLILGIGYEY